MMQRLSRVGAGDRALLAEQGDDVVEIPLLLQGWQMTALETAAHERGLTAGEMVRDLLRDFLARLPDEPAERSNGKF
jgi:hypothetical protein